MSRDFCYARYCVEAGLVLSSNLVQDVLSASNDSLLNRYSSECPRLCRGSNLLSGSGVSFLSYRWQGTRRCVLSGS